MNDQSSEQVRRASDAGHVGLVVELAERYLVDFPSDNEVLVDYADALMDLALYEEALVATERLRALGHSSRMIYRRLGQLYERKGDLAEAERWYRRAMAEAPERAGERVFLGSMLERAGLLAEAEAEHRAATQCTIGHIEEAYFNLGLCLRALRRYREARECFQEALKRDPEYAEVHVHLSDVEAVLSLAPTA